MNDKQRKELANLFNNLLNALMFNEYFLQACKNKPYEEAEQEYKELTGKNKQEILKQLNIHVDNTYLIDEETNRHNFIKENCNFTLVTSNNKNINIESIANELAVPVARLILILTQTTLIYITEEVKFIIRDNAIEQNITNRNGLFGYFNDDDLEWAEKKGLEAGIKIDHNINIVSDQLTETVKHIDLVTKLLIKANEAEEKAKQAEKEVEKLKEEQSHNLSSLVSKNNTIPMLTGGLTRSLAMTNKQLFSVNPYNGQGELTFLDHKGKEVKLTTLPNELTTKLAGVSVGAKKLFFYALGVFTYLNNTNDKQRIVRTVRCPIDLRVYATLNNCNYDDKDSRKNFKRSFKRFSKELENTKIRFFDKNWANIRGANVSKKDILKFNEGSYAEYPLKSTDVLHDGDYYYYYFSLSTAEYLINLSLTMLPLSLIGLSDQNENSFNIGFKMADQYFNNAIDTTSESKPINNKNVLRVSTLLKCTSLPDIENKSVKKVGWKTRIKKPFEKHLDNLIECGFLKEWYYCHSVTHKKIQTKNINDIRAFADWSNILVYFDPVEEKKEQVRG